QGRELLDHVDEVTPVAVRNGAQRLAAAGVERQWMADRVLRALEQRLEGIVVEPPQHEHLRAREQRSVELERRIFRGGADQRDGAILDIRQEAVLLRAVEAV